MGYHEYFSSRLQDGERVLDVGCGYGALAESMSRAGAIVCGFDINRKSIEQARARYTGPNLTYIVGDITTTDLPGRFETVVLSNVLEHIENRLELLHRLREKVSPKRFLIRVPMIDRDWMVYFRRELELPYFSDSTHFIEYTLESFLQEMKEARLEVSSYVVKWGELYAEAVPLDNGTAAAGTKVVPVS
jgi:2-polyprenyl-3-methyl-5-hydroxy-6-metoxy-1,4-benzoquinol methylase